MSGTPCKSVSFGARMNINRKSFGLHACPSNLWFTAYQAIHNISQAFKPTNRIIFVENVVPANDQDTQELDNTAGHRSEMHTTQKDGMKRKRFIWTSIPIAKPIQLDLPLEHIQENKEWSYQSNVAFPTLRAIFPSLFWRMADQDPTLSHQDKKTISNCFVLHQPSNTPRLPDIKLWMHMMGIDMISFRAIVDTLPCLGDVSIHPKPPAKSRMEPCGLNACCHNCSEILSHLGEAWNLRSSTERLTMTLKAFAELHITDTYEQTEYSFKHVSFPYSVEPHVCSNRCSKARSKP